MTQYSFDSSKKKRVSLKAKRVDLELTLEQASNLIGISKHSLHNYERYKNVPSVEVALKIAKAYGVEVDDLKFARDETKEVVISSKNE